MRIRNARVMTCRDAALGVIERGTVAVEDGVIIEVGEDRGGEGLDAGGRLVTPGLIDCHTHAIFAGDRANEFALRARGAGYLEIARAGGGIAATLVPTRAASDDELLAGLVARLDAALAAGTTAIEVKSGYDLRVEGELRLLRVVKRAAAGRAQRVVPTLLAHLIPAERAADREAYVDEIARALVPAVARERLATSVDVYCDEGAFTLDETRAILEAARDAGLGVRAHAGQFRDLGAVEMLAELGALSADHVEQLSDAGIAALARAGTVAVMLPGACVQLRLPVPPVAKLRAAGVALAVASDLNPGSSFCETLFVQLWLATTHYQMTVEEAWLGVTRVAARALGIAGGVIEVGGVGGVVLWNVRHEAEVPYRYGAGASLIDRVVV